MVKKLKKDFSFCCGVRVLGGGVREEMIRNEVGEVSMV